jgi:hypothetical protein
MTFVATAIIGSGVIGAAGTAIAGSDAASATQNSTNASISEQNKILNQNQQNSQPYLTLGSQGISQYENLLGLGPNGAAGAESTLASTPGYQFAKNQGIQATQNQANATGMGLSGNTLQALDTFSTGLADSTYQQAVGNAGQAVGFGQAAAAGAASNLNNAGNNISSALTTQGTNQANIDINTIAGISKNLGGAASNLVTNNTNNTLANLNMVPQSGGIAPG